MAKNKKRHHAEPMKTDKDRDTLTDAEENMRAIEAPQLYDDREPVLGPPRWLKNAMQKISHLFHTSKEKDASPRG